MTLNPSKKNSMIIWACSPYVGTQSTYKDLPPEIKPSLVASIIRHLGEYDPFAVYEKDTKDLMLSALAQVVETRGKDALANDALIDAVLTVFVYGNKKVRPAFAKEITAALQGTLMDDEQESSE